MPTEGKMPSERGRRSNLLNHGYANKNEPEKDIALE